MRTISSSSRYESWGGILKRVKVTCLWIQNQSSRTRGVLRPCAPLLKSRGGWLASWSLAFPCRRGCQVAEKSGQYVPFLYLWDESSRLCSLYSCLNAHRAEQGCAGLSPIGYREHTLICSRLLAGCPHFLREGLLASGPALCRVLTRDCPVTFPSALQGFMRNE